jgi:hypothetical protein
MLSEVPAHSAECVALLSFGQRIVPSRGTGVMARLWLTRPQAHGVQVYTARTREAVVSSKMFESLVSRCLVVERLKVQSIRSPSPRSRSLAATALDSRRDSGTNCPGNCSTAGAAVARAATPVLPRDIAPPLQARRLPRQRGQAQTCARRRLAPKRAHIHKKERTQTRWTPRAAPLLRCG